MNIKAILVGLLAFVACTTARAAATVYPGCTTLLSATQPGIPTNVKSMHYIDPIHGSMSGDGSYAHPWHTLAEVISANLVTTAPHPAPNASIKPGDSVFLMNGDHGKVLIQGDFSGPTLAGYDNSQFISFIAMPGQKPVIEVLTLKGGNKFLFRGITFQSLNTSGSAATAGTSIPDHFLVYLYNRHSDIILDNNTYQSQSTPFTTMADWRNKRMSGILDTHGHCISITNNVIRNIGFGMQTQNSTDVLIASNKIDYFADDGIDYGSDHMQILNNTITNSVEDGDGFHRDAMQGQPYNEITLVTDVLIDSNTVIRDVDQNNPFPGSLQVIDTFDGLWSGVTVNNNYVSTFMYQGISFYGTSYSSITNNKLVRDSGRYMPCLNLTATACEAQTVAHDTTSYPWIMFHASKANVLPVNDVIDGNTTSAVIDQLSGVTVTDNTCSITVEKSCHIAVLVNGVIQWYGKPGVYAGNNTILP